MSKQSVAKFRQALLSANGDRIQMKETFKSISGYLHSTISEKQTGQTIEDFLDENPGIKEIQKWSKTVLVNDKYQLVNY